MAHHWVAIEQLFQVLRMSGTFSKKRFEELGVVPSAIIQALCEVEARGFQIQTQLR